MYIGYYSGTFRVGIYDYITVGAHEVETLKAVH